MEVENMSTAITTDSGCDLFPDLYLEKKVDVIPLYITIGDHTSRDFFEIKPQDVFRDFAVTKKLPKTAAPAPADFYEVFKKHVDAGQDVVHLSMNSKMSASYQNAVIAAQEFENVYVVNTFTISSAEGLMVLDACDLRDQGKSGQEIAALMEQEKDKIRTYVLLDTLEFAYRGGRASKLLTMGANLLKLRPCLLLSPRGELSVHKKFRGNYPQVCREYVRHILEMPNICRDRVMVCTTGMDQTLLESLVQMIKNSGVFKKVFLTYAGCTTTVHTGPNTFVVFYKEN